MSPGIPEPSRERFGHRQALRARPLASFGSPRDTCGPLGRFRLIGRGVFFSSGAVGQELSQKAVLSIPSRRFGFELVDEPSRSAADTAMIVRPEPPFLARHRRAA